MYTLLTALGVLFVAYQLIQAIRLLYFHPLSSFPGPRLWIAFPIIHHLYQCYGTFDQKLMKFHAFYGDVVRFSDDSLSFNTAQAWKDIYGYGHGYTQWPKRGFAPPGSPASILFSNDRDHARFRRALGHAFSDGALRQQEDLIKGYVDLLIKGLREETEAGRAIDATMFYNLATFDIIADLAFGEPSHCLENKKYSSFVATIFRFMRLVPFFELARYSPLVWKVINLIIVRGAKMMETKLVDTCKQVVSKRKNDRSRDGKGDFFESMLKYEGTKDEISDDELMANANILFMAGSETTATLLAGASYYMLRDPEILKKAITEVRGAFHDEEDITFISASSKLPYMLACLEEALRLYPPVPTILVRQTPEPEIASISGFSVPPNTQVGVHPLSTNTSPTNFHDPHSFVPERWLPSTISDPSSPYYDDNRDARQPFSVGPRNCIGKNLAFSEMRQILARVLWNFDLELVDGENNHWEKQKIYTMWDKGPLNVRVKVRESLAS